MEGGRDGHGWMDGWREGGRDGHGWMDGWMNGLNSYTTIIDL